MATAAGAQPGGTAARQRGGGGMRASFTDGGGDTNGFATKKLVARLSRNEGRQEPGTVPFGHFAGDVGQVWPKGEGGGGANPGSDDVVEESLERSRHRPASSRCRRIKKLAAGSV